MQPRTRTYGRATLPHEPHAAHTRANPRTTAVVSHTRNTRARTTPPRRPTQALGVNTPHRHEHTNTPPRGCPLGVDEMIPHTHARTRLGKTALSVLARDCNMARRRPRRPRLLENQEVAGASCFSLVPLGLPLAAPSISLVLSPFSGQPWRSCDSLFGSRTWLP